MHNSRGQAPGRRRLPGGAGAGYQERGQFIEKLAQPSVDQPSGVAGSRHKAIVALWTIIGKRFGPVFNDALDPDLRRVRVSRLDYEEVDFVGPALGGLGFEGKYSDRGLEKASATLRSICNEQGVMASRTLIGRASRGDVLFVPSSFVAYLLSE